MEAIELMVTSNEGIDEYVRELFKDVVEDMFVIYDGEMYVETDREGFIKDQVDSYIYLRECLVQAN